MQKRERDKAQLTKKRENQRKQKTASQRVLFERKIRGMKKFILQLSCGCCDVDVYFRDEQTLKDQINAIGFTVGGVIQDDLGQVVEGVDTFYSYRTEKDKNRSIDYLVERLLKIA